MNFDIWKFIAGYFAIDLLKELIWHKSSWAVSPKGPVDFRKRDQWTHTEPLRRGNSGTVQTLQWMARLARKDASDPRVRALALQIARNCPGHGFQCEIAAIFHYVRDKITYRKDPITQERVQDTIRTCFQFGSGDCDDKSVALAGLLGSLAHKSRFCVIGHSNNNFSHVYVEVYTDGEWIALDPTPERAQLGWAAESSHRAVFPIWR